MKLLAPNGKPSNLTAEQYKLVRTPEFKAWFGDWENDPENSSKVVDENGEPLVVYHRSKKIIYTFDTDKQLNGWLGKGFYFSESKIEFKDYGNKLTSVFLNVKNPFVVKGESPSDFLYELKKMFDAGSFDTTQKLKENSYDGVIYKHWDYDGKMFTCFEPNQIKLADGTNTTFDGSKLNIRLAEGGSIKKYKKKIMNKVKKGGITYGKSHAEGGIKVKNASTGDMLEVEGGEGIVNKRSMASDKKVKLNGKDMSLCEAVSQLNQMEGGVQFNCDDVADRQFLEEMALGGELERGTRTEKEHIQVLKDLYAKRITPAQATKRIAKDHLKEDKRYYSKLAKMEGKMTKGGEVGKSYDVPSTEELVEMVTRAKDEAIKYQLKLGTRVVVGRYDGYYVAFKDGDNSDLILSSRPSRRKVIELIQSNPKATEITFVGAIRGADRVGEEMEFLDDFAVTLWKKPIDPEDAIGVTFQYTATIQDPKDKNKEILADESFYLVVDQKDARMYRDRPRDEQYIYLNSYNEKNGQRDSSRMKKSNIEFFEKDGVIKVVEPNYIVKKELLKPIPDYEYKMAKGGIITDADGLKGHIVKFYEQGVKDPNFYTIAKAYYSDPSYRFKTLSIDFVGGGTEVLSEGQIEAFLKGEQVQMKTYGKYDFYAIQLTPRKMKNGGQTTDCGCGLTYAEGGFVEDNSPLEVGDVVYVIDNSKPRNEWLRGVYVSKQGKDANVVITDADANQFEKTISFDNLIKLDIAQANPSDFKLFNQEFSKAKDNYFESVSKIGIIEEKINRAKMFPDANPENQKNILSDLKNELSKAQKFRTEASGELADVKNVPSAFYRYDKGGLVSIDSVESVLNGLSKKVFDLGHIKLNEKKLGNDFSTIFLQDLSIPVVDRNNWVGKYMFSIKDIPTSKIEFDIKIKKPHYISIEFSISTRNLRRKSGFEILTILPKLGFKVENSATPKYLSVAGIESEGRSKKFNIRFGEKYFNLFKSGSAIADLIEYFKVVALMLIVPIPYQGLEKRDGKTINNMREVFANGEIEENKGDSGSGSGGKKSYWRFKTEQELIDEYGSAWRSEIAFARGGQMDYLLGKRIEDFRLEKGQPLLGLLNTKDAYGISSGVDDNWRIYNLKPFKLVIGEKSDGEEGGSDADAKINKFIELYAEEFLNPKAWKPKSGESEVRGLLNKMVTKQVISKAEWDECVKVNKTMNDLAEKVKDLPNDSVLFKVVTPKIYEQAKFLMKKSENIIKDLDSFESLKYTSDEKIEFPILMMKIWGHEPSLDSSIFE